MILLSTEINVIISNKNHPALFANGPGDLGSIPGRVIPKTQKWYLMPPCLTLSIIRYGSRVKWSNPGKGVAPSPTPWCSKLSKREPSGHPRLWSPTLLLFLGGSVDPSNDNLNLFLCLHLNTSSLRSFNSSLRSLKLIIQFFSSIHKLYLPLKIFAVEDCLTIFHFNCGD